MSIKTILFDLDGTLLPMDQDIFINQYLTLLATKMAKFRYNPSLFVKSIWQGTMCMIQNNGTKTNEEVFWDKMQEIYTQIVLADIDKFELFYLNEFEEVKNVCGYTEEASKLIEWLKGENINLILATNPIFPHVATSARIRWAGLNEKDFSYVTTYENSTYCKPNIKYYQEILNKLNLKPEECLMVGNDATEDMVAEKLGMKVFLLTDNLINKNNIDINNYSHGSFKELITYINQNR